jgi:hypothetical protein
VSSTLNCIRLAALPAALISAAAFSFVGDVSARNAEGAWSELMAAWGAPAFAPGEVIVCFRAGVGESDIEEAVKKVGGEIVKRGAVNPRRVVLSVPDGEEDKYVDAYRELKEVRTAEKNYVFEAQPAAGGPGGH